MIDEHGTARAETEVLRAEIEHTRDELAQTAQALGAKLDMKRQARSVAVSVQERVQQVLSRAAAQWSADPVPIVAAGGTFLAVLAAIGWWERR